MTPIINNERHRNKFVVAIEKLIMFVCTLLLWYFLLRHIFNKLLVENYVKTIEILFFLALVALGIFLLLLLWQEYNIHMYRKSDRRKSRGLATDELVAVKFHIDASSLPALRRAKYLQVRKDGAISYYRIDSSQQEVIMRISAE